MYDMHIHTSNSHDCTQSIDEICLAALERGLDGIAICDHADMGPYDVPGSVEAIENSIAQVNTARSKYNLSILQGIEMAGYEYDTAKAKKILNLCHYDVVLGSVHYIHYRDAVTAYSGIDFSAMSQDDIKEYMDGYFISVAQMIQYRDFDVLAHLTCPMRYINGRYNMHYDIMKHQSQIKDILHKIICKGIALEVNTSGAGGELGDFMPHREILQMYADMGGKLVTAASDAHTPDMVGNALVQALCMIKDAGIDSFCIYKSRKPISIKIAL